MLIAAACLLLAAFRALAIALHGVYVKTSSQIQFSALRLHGADHINLSVNDAGRAILRPLRDGQPKGAATSDEARGFGSDPAIETRDASGPLDRASGAPAFGRFEALCSVLES